MVVCAHAAGLSAEQETGIQAQSGQLEALGRAAAAAKVGGNEDSEVWRQQRKHMFVLTHAGEPMFAAGLLWILSPGRRSYLPY